MPVLIVIRGAVASRASKSLLYVGMRNRTILVNPFRSGELGFFWHFFSAACSKMLSMSGATVRESWNSRLGVILAVAGSAVGLGNFLRFPGQAAQYGGGAFMIAYFVSFVLIGLPICWAEWTMGRYGGRRGFHSSPGILHAITRSPAGKYIGVIGVIIPVVIYMYYVYIESWCLGYAVNFLRGELHFGSVDESTGFWATMIGAGEDGAAVGFGLDQVGMFLLICFVLNFFLIYRGISKGIEFFCKIAMPALVVMAIVILFRVLTLGAPEGQPDNTVAKGLGYMWNPNKTVLEERSMDGDGERWSEIALLTPSEADERAVAIADNPNLRITETTLIDKLLRPQVWLAAAGQIFFSLSVGFGVIITYSSYLRRDDDVVLSGLSATSANEFCEVALGGLITVPAAYVFLGLAGVAGQGTFDLGFKVLPMVFSTMPGGGFFGFLFFFLLFLAAVTSSLSMLQPGIAFLEEALNLKRRQSVALLGLITAIGCGFVVYFSKDVKALDTLDFWVGTFLIYVFATVQIILFGWVFGLEKGIPEAETGASIKIPRFFLPLMKFVTPAFLLIIFGTWVIRDVLAIGSDTGPVYYITDLFGGADTEPLLASWLSIGLVGVLAVFLVLVISQAPKFKSLPEEDDES